MQEMQVWSLRKDDPLEQSIAIHSSIVARKIPWTEKSSGLWSMGSTRVRHVWSDWTHSWFMASAPITSWQIEEEKVEAVTDFLFLGSKITADGNCSHEIKRCLLFARKAMINLDSMLKSRDLNFLTKAPIVKAMVFPVVMIRCAKELMLLNCGARKDSWEFLALQRDQTSQT